MSQTIPAGYLLVLRSNVLIRCFKRRSVLFDGSNAHSKHITLHKPKKSYSIIILFSLWVAFSQVLDRLQVHLRRHSPQIYQHFGRPINQPIGRPCDQRPFQALPPHRSRHWSRQSCQLYDPRHYQARPPAISLPHNLRINRVRRNLLKSPRVHQAMGPHPCQQQILRLLQLFSQQGNQQWNLLLRLLPLLQVVHQQQKSPLQCLPKKPPMF